MKKQIVLILILSLAYPSYAQNVTIPDANFKAALIQAGVDTDANGEISITEAEAVSEIDVYSKGISDLTGIEAFINLESLGCTDNQLTSLDVFNNTALITLGCSQNQLTSLDVTNNIALEWLSCDDNQLTDLNVTNNTSITFLSCGSNQLSSLDISNNTALEVIWCEDNQITSLDVSKNIHLRNGPWGSPGLDCSNNQLTNLDVSNNTALYHLKCDGNQLTSLDVYNNTVLAWLSCDENQLASLDISGNSALENINIEEMPTLYEVCVWEGFRESIANTTGSPNVYFTTTGCLITALSEYLNNNSVAIYPNPATDQLNIEFDQPHSTPPSVMLFDISGKLVYSEMIDNTDSQTHTINLSSLRKGLYFIRISNDEYSITEKVIKAE